MKFFDKVKTIHQERKMNKKGLVQQLGTFAIMIAVSAVVIGLMASVLSTIRDGQTVNGFAYNASTNGLSGLNTFSSYLPTVALVLVAAIIIGLVLTYLSFRGRGQ